MGQVRTVRRESSCPTISTSSASAKHGRTKRFVLESRRNRRRETEAILCVILATELDATDEDGSCKRAWKGRPGRDTGRSGRCGAFECVLTIQNVQTKRSWKLHGTCRIHGSS